MAYGQGNHALLFPERLDGALSRAQQHWAYGDEPDDRSRLLTAAAKLAHGVGQAQSFEDGNKRTAYWLTRHFLDENGLGHVSPGDLDDEELADHLIGYGEGTHDWPHTAEMFQQRDRTPRQANILDPIHNTLDPSVWESPEQERPKLRPEHHDFIKETVVNALDHHGYDGMEKWLTLCLTGSLTTYQYSPDSDCDISLFVDTKVFPDWSRAEMIGLMIETAEGMTLPGTTHPMQFFVVSNKFKPEDLYKPGLRSAYSLDTNSWVVPPERDRSHDVEREENEAYTIALENADKMEKLLRYEPDKAIMFWHQIHKRRMRDMNAGKGDYAPSNITYKMLANRGLFPQIAEVSGEYIA